MFMLLILAASMLTAPMGDIIPAGETDTHQVKIEGRVGWGFETPGAYGFVQVFDKNSNLVGSAEVENDGFYSIFVGSIQQANARTPFHMDCIIIGGGSLGQVVSGIEYPDDFVWIMNPVGCYWQHIESFFFNG